MRKIITLTIFFFCLCLSYLYVNTDSRLSKKIWLHRANNINKAKHFQKKYAGLEIDITFVDSLKTFLVQHGGGLKEDNTATLEQWFNEIKKANKLGFWLDFKNLNDNNKNIALDELNRICSEREKEIKREKIIIESWSAKNLPIFKKAGYKTSFYIPNFNPEKSSDEDIKKHTEEIKNVINSYNPTFISGYFYQYQFMRDSFPNKKILIWYHLDDKKIQEEYIKIANNDNKVNVLLIADEIPNHTTNHQN